MNFKELIEKLIQLDGLIKESKTSRLHELAKSLQCTSDHSSLLISKLRSLGFEIAYDNRLNSYVYTKEYSFEIVLGKQPKKRIWQKLKIRVR